MFLRACVEYVCESVEDYRRGGAYGPAEGDVQDDLYVYEHLLSADGLQPNHVQQARSDQPVRLLPSKVQKLLRRRAASRNGLQPSKMVQLHKALQQSLAPVPETSRTAKQSRNGPEIGIEQHDYLQGDRRLREGSGIELEILRGSGQLILEWNFIGLDMLTRQYNYRLILLMQER